MYRSGMGFKKIATVYGVHYTNITQIVKRKIWKHVP